MIYIEIVRRTPMIVHNPDYCAICGRPLRPGQVQALLIYQSRDMEVAHLTCYAARRRAEKVKAEAKQRRLQPTGGPS